MRKRLIAAVCFFVISFSFFSRAGTIGSEHFEAVRLCVGCGAFFGLLGVIYVLFASCAKVFDG